MFNLLVLDYFGLFSFEFRLSVHLDLTSKSVDQKLLKDLLLINILRDSLDIQGIVNKTFFHCITIFHCLL